MEYMESIKKLEEKWTINQHKHAANGEVILPLVLVKVAVISQYTLNSIFCFWSHHCVIAEKNEIAIVKFGSMVRLENSM